MFAILKGWSTDLERLCNSENLFPPLNTRYKHDVHMPNSNSTSYYEGIIGIKLPSNLLPNVKSLNRDFKQFKPAIEKLSRSF